MFYSAIFHIPVVHRPGPTLAESGHDPRTGHHVASSVSIPSTLHQDVAYLVAFPIIYGRQSSGSTQESEFSEWNPVCVLLGSLFQVVCVPCLARSRLRLVVKKPSPSRSVGG